MLAKEQPRKNIWFKGDDIMNETKDFVIENSVLKQYTGPGSNVVIPDGVTAIGGNSCDDGAFYKRKDITSVIIPDSVTNICELAFYDCYNLTSIFIPDSVVSIGDNTFQKRKNCKWKSVPVDDRELNNFAVKKGNRILSAYIC